jgi:hypothetical protein
LKQRLDNAQLDDGIAALRPVADYVAQSPGGLFTNVLLRRFKEAKEVLDRARYHDGLQRRARGDVSEHPCGLELEIGLIVFGEAVDEDGQHARLNDLVDRWVLVRGEFARLLHGI